MFCTALATPAVAEKISLDTVGSYDDIDVEDDTKLIKKLTSRSERKREKALEEFLADPSTHSPPAIYAAAFALFENGDKDEAAFWYYSGQVRARFDANRCDDSSAAQAVGLLNQQYGQPINQHSFQDLVKLKSTVNRSIDWDRSTPHNYDHRWINLHGMAAVQASMEGRDDPVVFSKPEAEWEAIAEANRTEYLKGFEKALTKLQEMNGDN